MIDVDFWADVADKWTIVLDFEQLSYISEQAEITASETIGQNNEELLDLFSALAAYRDE